MLRHPLFVLCILATASCGGKKTAESCGPLKVTIDGQEIPGLAHGLAIANKRGNEVGYQIEVFNHDKTKCEEVLSKSGRMIPDGEKSVRAFLGSGIMGNGIGMSAHTQGQLDVTLVSAKPDKPGDVVQLCAAEATFEPMVGDNKNKKIVVKGLFQGKYCGVMDWDAK